MPITQGTGQFNVGRDCTVVLMGPFGRVQLDNVMSFDCKQETAAVKVDRLDGVQMQAELPKGWTGSFENERGSSSLDSLFASIEAAWYTSGTVSVSTLYQYVTEANGSTSTFQFDNVAIKLDDSGSWKGDASVKQRVSFMANRRRSV